MKIIYKITVLFIGIMLFALKFTSAQNTYYFPKAQSLDTKIPTPEQFLGYPVGSYFTRYEQVVAYLRELACFRPRAYPNDRKNVRAARTGNRYNNFHGQLRQIGADQAGASSSN